MSGRLKLIITLLFFVQIGVIVWSYYEKIGAKAQLYAPYQTYLENPLAVKTMDLSGLGVDELIPEIVQFQNVEILNLSNNRFDEIPAIIYKLPKLKVLNLSKNRIKRVKFLKNQTIEKLDLSNNKIKSTGYINRIESWKGLIWINLSNNKLKEPPYFNETHLDTILMSNNKLRSFYEINLSMPNEHIIEYLDVSGNPIDVRMGNEMYEFVSHQYLKEITNKCYALNISNIEYSYFPYEILFSADTKLHTLNISNSTFWDNEILLQSSDLKNLNLSNLKPVFTVEMFENFPRLETLYLENAIFYSFDFRHETLTKLYMNGLKCGAILELTAPKLEFLEINYDSAELLLNSQLPNIQTIRIRDYQKSDVEIIKKLESHFPNVKIEKR